MLELDMNLSETKGTRFSRNTSVNTGREIVAYEVLDRLG